MDNSSFIFVVISMVWLSPYISRFLKLPAAPVEILLGSTAAFYSLIEPNHYFDLISSVGFLYLMFLAGMEVELKEMQGTTKKELKTIINYLLLMVTSTLIAGYGFGLNKTIILTIPLISIGLLASLSRYYGKETPWIKNAIKIGVVGEILSIVSLTIFDASTKYDEITHLLMEIGILFLFIVGIYLLYKILGLIFWWLPEIKKLLVPTSDNYFQDIRLAMAIFFSMISIMMYLRLEIALGAFIGGVAISAFFHHEKELEKKVSSLGFGLLIPLFFIHVGSLFDLKLILDNEILIGAATILITLVGSRVIASMILVQKIGLKGAISVGLSLSMPLTLVIAIATIGYDVRLIDYTQYNQLVLASIVEVLLSIFLIKIIQKGG